MASTTGSHLRLSRCCQGRRNGAEDRFHGCRRSPEACRALFTSSQPAGAWVMGDSLWMSVLDDTYWTIWKRSGRGPHQGQLALVVLRGGASCRAHFALLAVSPRVFNPYSSEGKLTNKTCSSCSARCAKPIGNSFHKSNAWRERLRWKLCFAKDSPAPKPPARNRHGFPRSAASLRHRAGVEWLTRLQWSREEKIEGLPLVEADEIALASALAVREAPGWEKILNTQLERTQNPDRKARASPS